MTAETPPTFVARIVEKSENYGGYHLLGSYIKSNPEAGGVVYEVTGKTDLTVNHPPPQRQDETFHLQAGDLVTVLPNGDLIIDMQKAPDTSQKGKS